MKYKLVSSKNWGGKFISISLAFSSICAITLMQNCAFGSKVKSREVPALKLPYTGKQWGPEMVYVEGGLVVTGGRFGSPFSAGGTESKVVTVSAFYMSKTAVTNRDYMKYLDDLINSGKVKEYKAAIPNSTVWEKKFVFNDSLKNYLFARVFLDYPVVGLTYKQCVNYCIWLTEKERTVTLGLSNVSKRSVLNKSIAPIAPVVPVVEAVAAPVIPVAPAVVAPAVDAAGVPIAPVAPVIDSVVVPVAPVVPVVAAPKPLTDEERLATLSRGASLDKETRAALLERGVPLTDEELAEALELESLTHNHKDYVELAGGEQMLRYRLPTEAEYDFATKATQVNQDEHGVETTMVGEYGQAGSTVRFMEGKHKGEFVGLYKRGEGDYKGVPGSNQTDAPTEEVNYRPANGLGLCTLGNVWKWISDEYRQTPAAEFSDLNPVRVDGFLDDSYDKSSPMSRRCRVIKGGSYAVTPEELRSYMDEDEAASDVGFMVAASVA